MTAVPHCFPADAEVVIDVDESIYNRSTVLRACYWYTDRCYVFVERKSPNILAVHMHAKDGADLSATAGEFANALLDYELRREIDLETGKIRELLVAKAVSTADLSNNPRPANSRAEQRGG